jgi:hypothetical protein
MDFSALLTKHGFTPAAEEGLPDFAEEKGEAQSLPGTEDKEKENGEAQSDKAADLSREKGKLVRDEERDQGAVKLSVYLTYFKEGGSLLWLLFLVVFVGGYLTRILQVMIVIPPAAAHSRYSGLVARSLVPRSEELAFWIRRSDAEHHNLRGPCMLHGSTHPVSRTSISRGRLVLSEESASSSGQ